MLRLSIVMVIAWVIAGISSRYGHLRDGGSSATRRARADLVTVPRVGHASASCLFVSFLDVMTSFLCRKMKLLSSRKKKMKRRYKMCYGLVTYFEILYHHINWNFGVTCAGLCIRAWVGNSCPKSSEAHSTGDALFWDSEIGENYGECRITPISWITLSSCSMVYFRL